MTILTRLISISILLIIIIPCLLSSVLQQDEYEKVLPPLDSCEFHLYFSTLHGHACKLIPLVAPSSLSAEGLQVSWDRLIELV